MLKTRCGCFAQRHRRRPCGTSQWLSTVVCRVMRSTHLSVVVIVLSPLGCKREVETPAHAPVTAPVSTASHDAGAVGSAHDAGAAGGAGAAWYRAVVRAAD